MFNINQFRTNRQLKKLEEARGFELAGAIRSAIEGGDMAAIDDALNHQVGMNESGQPQAALSGITGAKFYPPIQYARVIWGAISDKVSEGTKEEQKVRSDEIFKNWWSVSEHLSKVALDGQFPVWKDSVLINKLSLRLEMENRACSHASHKQEDSVKEITDILDMGADKAVWRRGLEWQLPSCYNSEALHKLVKQRLIVDKPADRSEYALEVVAPLVRTNTIEREPAPKSMSM